VMPRRPYHGRVRGGHPSGGAVGRAWRWGYERERALDGGSGSGQERERGRVMRGAGPTGPRWAGGAKDGPAGP
jgi:hypothetical protein